MSEEEKKAIEYLENRLDILHNNTQWATEKSIKVVLNLTEKQQKEIEELRQNRDEYKEEYIKLQNAKYYNYISKDKIKELKEKVEKEMISNPYDFSYMINELLEENNE